MIKRVLLWGLVSSVLGLAGLGYFFLATYEDPAVDPNWAVEGSSEIPEGSVTVRYTGTSTLLFSDGETDWMVDGWFSRFGPIEITQGQITLIVHHGL